jgi:putative endonuclease
MRQYYVYILASINGVLYVGVTNDLQRRLLEHRTFAVPGFTRRYRVSRLVYYEVAEDVRDAIAHEKQIKGWVRRKKAALIAQSNPGWRDLALGLFGDSSLDAQNDTFGRFS